MPERGGQQGTSVSIAPYYNVSYGQSGTAIAGWGIADWFGPGSPLPPSAPRSVRGRVWDFPVGYNQQTKPRSYEPTSFADLRGLADAYDLLRLVIETRKDQMEKLPWRIRPKAAELNRRTAKVPAALEARGKEITGFFERPDGEMYWSTWLRSLLEDLLVIDAPALYCERQRGGKINALVQLDGATIKRVVDDWGRTPQPYSEGGKLILPAAYQQELKGLPALDYTARDLIYRPRNVRPHKAYGYSPVEQIIMTVNIALRRQLFQLSYYTEGNIPEALIGTPDTWTADQVIQFQEHWDLTFTGNFAQRRHAKFVPGGVAKTYIPTKEPELKNVFDEWLARVVCYAFSVPAQAFMAMMNRATASTAKEQSEEEGLEPIKKWVKGLVDHVITTEFDAPELEFAWAEEAEIDPVKQEGILTGYTKAGGITLNELRDELGRDPYDDPAADIPMVLTASGYVPIDANTIEGKQANLDAFGPPPAPGGFGAAPEPQAGQTGDAKPPSGDKPKDGATKLAKRARRLAPVPFDRREGRRAVRAVKAAFAGAFVLARAKAAGTVRVELSKAEKASDRTKVDKIAGLVDLSDIDAIEEDVADALADFAGDTSKRALVQVGVDAEADLVNQVNERAVAAARERAADLVTGIDENTRSMLADIIASGLEDNIGLDEIIARIEEAGAFSDDRAELIAATEVSRANSDAALEGYTVARDEAGVMVKKEWLTADDDLVSDECEANGEQGAIDLDDEFESGDYAPPAHPNCLPGDSLVSAENVSAATKRWYDGDIVVIHTASGKNLRCTPNHPVLTPDGWVPAGVLNKGGYVISSGLAQWGTLALDLDDDDVPARIEDVAEAFGRSEQVAAMPVPTAAEDFHGDGKGSEVAIVWADRVLMHGANAAFGKHASKVALGLVDMQASGHDGSGAQDLLIDAMLASARRHVGGFGLQGALLGRQRGHIQTVGFGLRPARDAGLFEEAFDNATSDAKLLGNTLLGDAGRVEDGDFRNGRGNSAVASFNAGSLQCPKNDSLGNASEPANLGNWQPGPVFIDTILNSRRVCFSGHVYNLQTETGYYIAGGIVVHNCRCALSPVVEEDQTDDADKMAKAEDQPRGDHGRFAGLGASAKATAEWLKGKSAKEVVAAVASSHTAKEGLSFALQSLVSHATGLDQSTWKLNEDLIEHTVNNFATIASVTGMQAKGMMMAAVSGMISARQKQVSAKLGKHEDPVIHILQLILAALEKHHTSNE